MAKGKWTEEKVAALVAVVGEDVANEVSHEQVSALAEQLEVSDRSVAAKLRNMGYPVEKTDSTRAKSFTDEQEQQLVEFVNAHSNEFTHAEIAAALFGDAISARQVQGKLLSLDMLALVKPTEHVEAPKKFTDAEEAVFIKLVNSGAFIEDIAATLDKEINSVRGKALSLLRKGQIAKIPAQKVLKATEDKDPLAGIEDIEDLTVEEIAKQTGKTERGVKSMLTKRGISVVNYNGAKKAEKAAEKKAAA
jgi:transposase